ncbi:hypothetical protein [Nocardiopsis sp. NRRL B-16309]|uniref:hypothetical protein n=1 Tax=Nocardiopsis sp. NRRL B-16309 TaxID=1519494 RepID=UPI0006AF7960|nr:hypothetical protein [Nocardiopsis sp. NRRL B-16309]KOX19658.1 hypothetical protein ADL05_05900 [Nocardiopsis sp. NRRL B-16309]
MSPRKRAALGAAALTALTLTGCAQVLEQADRFLLEQGGHMVGAVDFDEVDRDDPFSGSPAADYGVGFDTPEAAAEGDFTAEQVEWAQDRTQLFLETVYLDTDAVFDEDNSEFTGLLTGQSLEWYMDNLGHEDPELDSRHLPFNLTPGTAELIGDEIRVDGRMWAEQAQDPYGQDYLAVRTEYVVVYPIARPGAPVSTRLVVTHLGEVSFHDRGDGTLEAWPNWNRGVAPAHCLPDQFTFTPSFPDERPEGEQPRGRTQDAYDLEDTREWQGCASVEGT